MLIQLSLGSLLISATILIKAFFIVAASKTLTKVSRTRTTKPTLWFMSIALALSSIWLISALIVSISLWATTFWGVGLFKDFETAFYFAIVSFTTLGFGDIIIEGRWRLLSGMAATNGLILFSFTTAFLIETLRAFAITDRRAPSIPKDVKPD